MTPFARNAKSILRSERVPSTNPPQLRSRHAAVFRGEALVVPSPFNVDSMALYLQLGTAFLPPAPSLNPGLQYLKSVLYKDSTVEGSHVMREHLAAVEASQAAETLAREVKREGMELFRMAEEDATSSAFNYQDRIRAAAALEQYLQEQKAKYFDWTHQQKVRLVRDLESLHDVAAHQAKVHWTCVHCGTLNQRYMYACEFCGESSRMQGVEPVVESCSCINRNQIQ